MPDGLDGAEPCLVHGTARLAALAYAGAGLDDLLAFIGPEPGCAGRAGGWLLDCSVARALCFDPGEAAALQEAALREARVFRVRGEGRAIRLLALCAPGDLMVNAPLDFITQATDIRLDLAFLDADERLPPVPPHDVAIVAASDNPPARLDTLARLFDHWPRPILNDPRRAASLARDCLPRALHGHSGLVAPHTAQVDRASLAAVAAGLPLAALLPDGRYPVLLRPRGSHAGHGLMKVATPDDLRLFLLTTRGDAFYLTQFVEYRGPDGWHRKYRVAFVDGAPFLCHMAASERWMVHYLNAGMAESAAKRDAEAEAMGSFDADFARRHASAFAALNAAVGLDFFSIDCGETADGALLVFEADTAAIIHSMDPPDLYPYKRAPMQRCYNAFAAMLARRIASFASGAQGGAGGQRAERHGRGEHGGEQHQMRAHG